MGVKSKHCDDGKVIKASQSFHTCIIFWFILLQTNLTIDWDKSVEDYTCFNDIFVPNPTLTAEIVCDDIPKAYHVKNKIYLVFFMFYYKLTFQAPHKCMNTEIQYDKPIPTL